MTVNEWAKDFRSFVNELQIPRDDYKDIMEYIDDAVSMLKEQEAVKPKSKVRHGANAQIQHFCGNCNSMLHGKQKYCSECGQAVKWK